MSILDFFKQKKQELPAIENIKFKELEEFIEKQKKEISEKENSLVSSIKNKISELIENLEERTKILDKINLNDKKADERIKLIVRENLNSFVNYLRKLIYNLKNLDAENFDELIKKLNANLYDFEKKSYMNYEKATFIIGKELGSIKDSLAGFSREYNLILNDNKSFFENSKMIHSSETKLNEILNSNKKESEIDAVIDKLAKTRLELEKKNKNLKKEIEDIRQSESYSDEIKQNEEIERIKNNLKKNLSELKESINFKNLSNIFHSNEKKMNIIKNYKEDFNAHFEKGSELIINLLKESKIEIKSILEKINRIDIQKQEIQSIIEIKKNTGINRINDLESDKRKNNSEIENLENQKIKEQKIKEKIKEKKDEIVNELKNELMKINVNLIG